MRKGSYFVSGYRTPAEGALIVSLAMLVPELGAREPRGERACSAEEQNLPVYQTMSGVAVTIDLAVTDTNRPR